MLKRKSGKNKYNRFSLFLIMEIMLLLALLPGCFHRGRLVHSFRGDEIADRVEQKDGFGQFCSDRLALTPGVYQVRVWTGLSEEQWMQVYMDCDGAGFKALRCNVAPIYGGNDYQDFEVYVSDKVSTAYVQCDFFGTDSSALERLEVWKTNMGSRKLFVIAAAFFAVLDFLVIFRRRILEGRVTGKQQTVFWGLTAGILAAYFPYLTDYFFAGDDVFFHLSRISYLADALKQGASLPVRIEGTWLYGHGYNSSTFYGDLFLFIPALLQLAGFSVMGSYKIFLLLVTAATAYMAYFSFRKCVGNEYGALFGSLVYLLSPYRLYNVYGRAAVGEYLAMAFLPLVFCGVYLLYTKDPGAEEYKKYKWYIVWGVSGVLQSHLISTEMTALLLLMCCVIFCRKTFRRQTFFQLLEATGAVLAVNAWFWLPMLYMLGCDTYQIQEITGGDMQFTGLLFGNFFFWLPYAGSRAMAKNEVWVGAGAVMLILFYGMWRYRRKEKDIACDMAAVFSVLTLVLSTAYFPWNTIMKIPGIGYVAASLQFPWRWMSPATLFLGLLAAFLFRHVMEEGGVTAKAGMGVLAVLIMGSAIYHADSIVYETPPIYLYNENNMGTANVGGGEYMLPETELSGLHYHKPAAEEGLLWTDYVTEGTNVTMTLSNSTQEVRHIDIPLTGYKGYGVTASGSGAGHPSISEERGAHGDLRLEVPAQYQGTVEISYRGFTLFRVAEAVSLGSLAVLFCMYFCRKRKYESKCPIRHSCCHAAVFMHGCARKGHGNKYAAAFLPVCAGKPNGNKSECSFRTVKQKNRTGLSQISDGMHARACREDRNVLFWIAVISLLASVPCLCSCDVTGTELICNIYSIVLNIATACVSYLCFGKIFRSRSTGIVCSALYTLSIFRIYRLFVAGSIGEGTALVFLPVILCGLYRIFAENPEEKGYKTSWLLLLAGSIGIAVTHLQTCEITILAVLLFSVVCIRKIRCGNTALTLLKGGLPSLAVSLCLLVPLWGSYMTQGELIEHVGIQKWGIHLAQMAFHFWTPGAGTDVPSGVNGMQHSAPVGIGLILAAASGIFLVLWFSGKFQESDGKVMPFAKKTMLIGLLLLFMSMNVFPWDRIHSLHPIVAAVVESLQYPGYFLGWGTACMVLVFGFCLWYFENYGRQRFYWGMVMAAVTGITTSSMYLLDYVGSVRFLQ